MSLFKNTLTNIVSIIGSILLFVFFIGINIIPDGWTFKQVTRLWEGEYADVDWHKRLEFDMEICTKLINPSLANDEPLKYNRAVEEFSKEISKYPEDKKEFLKNGCKLIIDYTKNMSIDYRSSVQLHLEGKLDSINSMQYSPQTLQIFKSLEQYPQISQSLEERRKKTELSITKDSKVLAFTILVDKDVTFEKFQSACSEDLNNKMKAMQGAYEKIFSEKINQ